MGQALTRLADRENTIHLAEHPANTLYFLGSAVVFRTIFAMVAENSKVVGEYDERVALGARTVMNDVNEANFHLHEVLYGLIKALLEEALGRQLGEAEEVTNIEGAPTADKIGLPPWLDIGQ
jgi:hypothetical protein